jgi:hypothetical protein
MAAFLLWNLAGYASVASARPTKVRLGESVVALNGPWKFSLGDDPRWASPAFDDSKWESVDLTPAPGAHDADVGRSDYAPGWRARGHKGYAGFAWYRLHVVVYGAGSAPIALNGPASVDSAYQVFADGKLLGGTGDFGGRQPVVHAVQPRLFELPAGPSSKRRAMVIAVRAWTPPGAAAADGGGIRVAPRIGSLDGAGAVYQGQWLQTFKGYVVDAAEPVSFFLLALMALGLAAVGRPNAGYFWLAVALTLTAVSRANQVVYFWTGAESLGAYDVARNVVLTPLVMGAWVMAWRGWFGVLRANVWLGAIAVLTGLFMALALGSRPWFQPDGIGHGAVRDAEGALRLVFLAVLAFVVGRGVWLNRTAAGFLAVLGAILACVGLFAQELSAAGVKGTWFPYGVGVSRTQYAYAALIIVLFVMILWRFVDLARRPKAPPQVDTGGWGAPPSSDEPRAPAARRPPHRRQAGAPR